MKPLLNQEIRCSESFYENNCPRDFPLTTIDYILSHIEDKTF